MRLTSLREKTEAVTDLEPNWRLYDGARHGTPRRMEAKLIQGDCLACMPELPAESIDVVITSPPYNLGIDYGAYRDTVPRDAYLQWTVDWCREVKRLLKRRLRPHRCARTCLDEVHRQVPRAFKAAAVPDPQLPNNPRLKS